MGIGEDNSDATRRDAGRRHAAAGRLALAAHELPLDERESFLVHEAGGDEALLAAARNFLAGLDAGDGFLASGPGAALPVRELLDPEGDADGAVDGCLGRTYGDYRVLRTLGAGGMGVVYEAEQLSLGRLVALKLVAPGQLGSEALTRFRREARLLARLEHPGIALVHEAGETEDGAPFFAMELVRGRSLTEHAFARGLPVRERVELLARTCEAVGHVHDRDIVHRDLKPSNILVDENGQPKVLDFGVARETGLTDREALEDRTRTGQVVGTLRYMSPEQAAGEEASARADVYALGLVGHELLTGQLPYDTSCVPLDRALQLIREDGEASVDRLEAELGRDLATVLAKALEKEPERRYASASELAADLRRCLLAEPVMARRATRGYRLKMFVKRRRALVASTAAVFLALLAGTVLATHWGVRATQARRAAERIAYRASLSAASGDIRDGDRESAADHLAATAPELRGWEWNWLHEQAHAGTVLRRLNERVSGLAVSADGRALYVSVGERGDRELLRLGLPSLESERSWPLENASPRVPVEALLAVAQPLVESLHEPEGEVRSIDVRDESGQPLWAAKRCDTEALSHLGVHSPVGALSPTGRLATLGLHEGRGRHGVCDLQTGRFRLRTPEHGRALAFDPEGSRLAQADYDSVRVWDTVSGEELWSVTDEAGAFVSVAFSADGERLHAGTHAGSGRVGVWDARTGSLLGERAVSGGVDQAWAASSDTSRVAWAAGTGRLFVFDALLQRQLAELKAPVVQGLRLAFAGGGRFLVAAGHDFVQLWDLDSPEPRRRFVDGSYTYAVEFSPDGRSLVSGSWDGLARVRDAETGELLRTLRVPPIQRGPGASDRVTSVSHSRDGDRLAVATFDGRVAVFEAETGRLLVARRPVLAQGTVVVRFHPDGDRLLLTRQGAWILDAESLELRRRIDGAGEAGAWSHDGQLLVSGSQDFAAIFDAVSLEARVELRGPVGEQLSWVAWSHDDARVAVSALDGVVRVYRVSDGELLHELSDRGSGRAFGAIFSRDDRRVLSGADDGAVRSWDAESGELLATLPAHEWYVHSLAMAPEGLRLATGSGDGTTLLWDARPQAERSALQAASSSLRPAPASDLTSEVEAARAMP